ncbi:MAG: DNA repair and recombination protein RadA [Candidatus Thorarchaeota archaeon]
MAKTSEDKDLTTQGIIDHLKGEEKPKTSTRKKSASNEEVEFLDTIKGIGPTTKERLQGAGYRTKETIALATRSQLSQISGIADKTAELLIKEARARFDLGLKKGTAFAEASETRFHLTTGASTFDEMIGGGLESGSIAELAGENGCGKTQLCHQLAVNSIKYLDKDVIWIDTEGTFRHRRISQMAEALGLDSMKVLERITVGRAYNSEHQMALTEEALTTVTNIGLIIVDGLMSHFRSEFAGRSSLAERQQLIGKHLSFIAKQSDMINCVAVITNQVSAKPDGLPFGDPNEPIGGNVVGHTVTTRIRLYKGKDPKRTAHLKKNPELPDGKIEFAVLADGIRDFKK